MELQYPDVGRRSVPYVTASRHSGDCASYLHISHVHTVEDQEEFHAVATETPAALTKMV